MSELLNNTIRNGEWWFSAILVAIAVNLLSSFIWKKIEEKSIRHFDLKVLKKFLLLPLAIWFSSNFLGVFFGSFFIGLIEGGKHYYNNINTLSESFLLTAYFLPFLMLVCAIAFRIDILIKRRIFLFISAIMLALLVLYFMPVMRGGFDLILDIMTFDGIAWLFFGSHIIFFILITTLSASIIGKLRTPMWYNNENII